MPWENPWVYDEARKRIREKTERETIVIEERRESFEKGKEKIHSKKKLDVHELRRKIETGQSLELLKWDIREALDSWEISIDTYNDVLETIDDTREKKEYIANQKQAEFTLDSTSYPLANIPFTQYFESQKLGDNILVDMGWFAYGVAQGSLFLLYLAGRIILDALLLPVDLYKLATHNKTP